MDGYCHIFNIDKYYNYSDLIKDTTNIEDKYNLFILSDSQIKVLYLKFN